MDELVIIGGLVPSLLIDQSNLPPEITAHISTMDLDIGLQIALLKEEYDKSLFHTQTQSFSRLRVNQHLCSM